MAFFLPFNQSQGLQKRSDPSCVDGNDNIEFVYCSDSQSGFVGCCDVSKVNDPCKDGCGSSGSPIAIDAGNLPSVSLFYCKEDRHQVWQCYSSSPSFMGCCESDPCKQGNQCPEIGDMLLRPEYRDSEITVTASTAKPTGDSTEAPTIVTASASRTRDAASEAEKLSETTRPSHSVISTVTYTPGAASTSGASASPAATPSLTAGKIAGIAIGGLAALALLIALLTVLMRKYHRSRELSNKNHTAAVTFEKRDPPKDRELLPQHPTPADLKDPPAPSYTTYGGPGTSLEMNNLSFDNKAGSRPNTGIGSQAPQISTSFPRQDSYNLAPPHTYTTGTVTCAGGGGMVGGGAGSVMGASRPHPTNTTTNTTTNNAPAHPHPQSILVSELGGSDNPPTYQRPEFQGQGQNQGQGGYTSFPGTLNVGQAVEAPGVGQARVGVGERERRNAVWEMPEM